MDPSAMGAAAAEKGMTEAENDDADMTPEERLAARKQSMAEFADAHSRHDHEGMAHALAAHDSLLDEGDEKAGVSTEGAPEEGDDGEE